MFALNPSSRNYGFVRQTGCCSQTSVISAMPSYPALFCRLSKARGLRCELGFLSEAGRDIFSKGIRSYFPYIPLIIGLSADPKRLLPRNCGNGSRRAELPRGRFETQTMILLLISDACSRTLRHFLGTRKSPSPPRPTAPQ